VPASRAILSALIVLHLVAITIRAIPSPDRLSFDAPRHPPSNIIARTLTPIADTAHDGLRRVHPFIYRLSDSMRALTTPYRFVALSQNWRMFAEPGPENEYIRLRYYLTSSPLDRVDVVQELVFPAQREDRLRLTHAFRDKAFLNAFAAFSDARNRSIPDAGATHLGPVTRYYGGRYLARHPDEKRPIVRTELWRGLASITPPGQRLSEQMVEARLAVLRGYHEGKPPVGRSDPRLLRVGSREREADISWHLAFIDQP
jgi:hypothetical protein